MVRGLGMRSGQDGVFGEDCVVCFLNRYTLDHLSTEALGDLLTRLCPGETEHWS